MSGTYDRLILPVHLPNHWTRIAIDFTERTILFIDSRSSENFQFAAPPDTIDLLQWWLSTRSSHLRVHGDDFIPLFRQAFNVRFTETSSKPYLRPLVSFADLTCAGHRVGCTLLLGKYTYMSLICLTSSLSSFKVGQQQYIPRSSNTSEIPPFPA